MRTLTAGCRAGEDEPVDALGMGERELLRDHPAEARSEDVRTLDARLVQDTCSVARHLRGRVRPRRLVGLADSSVVEDDNGDLAARPGTMGSQPQRP